MRRGRPTPLDRLTDAERQRIWELVNELYHDTAASRDEIRRRVEARIGAKTTWETLEKRFLLTEKVWESLKAGRKSNLEEKHPMATKRYQVRFFFKYGDPLDVWGTAEEVQEARRILDMVRFSPDQVFAAVFFRGRDYHLHLPNLNYYEVKEID